MTTTRLATVRVVTNLASRVEQVVKAITLNIVANLRRAPSEGGTPVDTGWARANWIPTVGQTRVFPSGSRKDVTNAAQDAGVADVAANYTLDRGTVYISNSVPYIGLLNLGHSPQASPGFVQRAILEAVAQVEKPKS